MRTDFYPQRFMMPVGIGEAIGAGAGIIKSLVGVGQAIAGNRMMKKAQKNRPLYEIPDEFNQNVGLANDLFNLRGISSQYENNFLQGIGRNQAGGLAALNSLGRGSALAGVGNIVQSGNQAMGDLYSMAAERQLQNQRAGISMKSGALNQLAQQKLAKMQWDKFNPYIQKMQQGQALSGAGWQNIGGGLSQVASMGMGGGLGGMFGGGGAAGGGGADLSGLSASNPNYTSQQIFDMKKAGTWAGN